MKPCTNLHMHAEEANISPVHLLERKERLRPVGELCAQLARLHEPAAHARFHLHYLQQTMGYSTYTLSFTTFYIFVPTYCYVTLSHLIYLVI